MRTLKQILKEEKHNILVHGYGTVGDYHQLHRLTKDHALQIHDAYSEGRHVPSNATDLLHLFNTTLNKHRECCGPGVLGVHKDNE